MQGASLQSYDFTVPANGAVQLLATGNYYLVKSSNGALDIRADFGQAKGMVQGQGFNGRDFTKLELKNNSAAIVSGVMMIEDGAEGGTGFFDLNLILSGSITSRPEAATGSYQTQTMLAANTADQVIAPAANVNGALIFSLESENYAAFPFNDSFIAKSSAPSTPIDGVVLAASKAIFWNGSTYEYKTINVQSQILVPAGLGIYFISSIAMSGGMGSTRSSRYKLL